MEITYRGTLKGVEPEKFANEFIYMNIRNQVTIRTQFLGNGMYLVTVSTGESFAKELERLMTTGELAKWGWAKKFKRIDPETAE